MKILLACIALFVGFSSFAELERKVSQSTFRKTDSVVLKELASNESIYHFEILNLSDFDKSGAIIYSIDGNDKTDTLKNGVFEVKTTPGKHIFVIYVNETYLEMYSDSLEISPQTMDFYSVDATSTLLEIIVDKPVIYLYPEGSMDFTVRVHPKGTMAFTYPKYNTQWSGTATPDGKIQIDGANYPYLFWEAKQEMAPMDPTKTSGFMVNSENVLSFLEEKLALAGFTSIEKADFITYWAPRMIAHENVFVSFHQNERCDQFASLDITPKPDVVARFYMSWAPCSNTIQPVPQEITPISRHGFTVLEWGGQQLEVRINQLHL